MDFDINLAKTLAQWCQRAYVEADAQVPALDAYAIVRDAGPWILVAYRGTTNLKGWMQDFNVKFDRVMEGGCVHHGFNRVEDSTHSQVVSLVEAMPPKPVIITGHSLGAAQAARCASRWRSKDHALMCVYTFGQPRVGDAVWSKQYDARLKDITWRVVDEADIVARVPLLVLGYRFQGQEAFMPEESDGVEINPSLWEQTKSLCGNLAWELKNHKKPLSDLVTDHPIQRYIERLDKVSA